MNKILFCSGLLHLLHWILWIIQICLLRNDSTHIPSHMWLWVQMIKSWDIKLGQTCQEGLLEWLQWIVLWNMDLDPAVWMESRSNLQSLSVVLALYPHLKTKIYVNDKSLLLDEKHADSQSIFFFLPSLVWHIADTHEKLNLLIWSFPKVSVKLLYKKDGILLLFKHISGTIIWIYTIESNYQFCDTMYAIGIILNGNIILCLVHHFIQTDILRCFCFENLDVPLLIAFTYRGKDWLQGM